MIPDLQIENTNASLDKAPMMEDDLNLHVPLVVDSDQ